jgi:phospholipase/carboxylesterase
MPAKTDYLPCVEIEPKKRATHSIVWLHGLGADGNDFVPIVPHLGLDRGLDSGLAVRFVFPHAPRIPVAVNMGMVMPAWYDVRGPDLRQGQDEVGIRKSAEQVRALVEREIERGVPSRNIVIAGFSQGGAMAVFTALRYEKPLAGVIALSTYLVLAETLDAEISSANRGLAVFQAHGTEDPLVLFKRGEELHKRLAGVGCEVTWRTYPMQHEVCMEEIVEVGEWLKGRLASRS